MNNNKLASAGAGGEINQKVSSYEAQGNTLKQSHCFPNTKTPFTLQAPRLKSNYKTLHVTSVKIILKYTHNKQNPTFNLSKRHLSLSSRRDTAKMNTLKPAKYFKIEKKMSQNQLINKIIK